MTPEKKFVSLAIALALVGASPQVSRSQENPQQGFSKAEPSTFAGVDSYLQLNVQAMEKRYVVSLACPSQGVVEAALREITRVKLAHPSSSMSSVEEKFKGLAAEGETPTIRYKAMLGLQVFENPKLFLDLACFEFKTEEEMFTAISRRLEESLLAGNI